ncbi:MAG: TolC family protein [Spirochaetia bacterium]|nr:TolC family protein [Spirochaetia bacterium]
MKLKQILFLFILFSVFSWNVFSAENGELSKEKILTLEECISLAKENNLSIKVHKNTLNDLKRKNETSWNSVSPSIKGDALFQDDFTNKTTESFSISGSLGLTLSTNLYSTIKGAKLNYENGLLTYNQAVKQIEMSVWKTFYDLIYKTEYFSFQSQNLLTAKKNYEQNLEKFKNGKISELDVMSSRVSYEQKKPVLEEARIDLTNNLELFKNIIGVDFDDEIKLDGSLDFLLELKDIKLPPKENPSPDVQAAKFAVEIAENNLLAQRFSSYSPVITGTYKYGQTLNIDNSLWNETSSLSVGVSIPLDSYLPWSSSAVSINSKKESLESAKLNLEDAEKSIRVNTENALRKINQIISMLEVSKETVALAKKTYEMTETAYNYGKTDFLTLQNASDNVLNAEVSLKNQAKTLMETLLDTEYLLGLEFGTILKLSTE